MPAHKHCELLVPTSGTVIIQVGNGPGQFFGSYEASWVHTTVTNLGWTLMLSRRLSQL